MNRIVICLVACAAINAQADGKTEHAQERFFLKCVASQSTGAQDRETIEACMREAGIEKPDEAKAEADKKSWVDCLTERAGALDDRISPASDVALAIMKLCNKQWVTYTESLWLLPSYKRDMGNSIEKYGTDDAIRAVLSIRRNNRPR
jgi:hypothetical protein